MAKVIEFNSYLSEKDYEMFDKFKKIIPMYTLGKKEIIGLRQLFKIKVGEDWVNKHNHSFSYKNKIWRHEDFKSIFKMIIIERVGHFILVIKEKTGMLYLVNSRSKIPDGFKMYTFNH